MDLQRVYNRVIFDELAYLHASVCRLESDKLREVVSDEAFQAWQDEWKRETADLVKRIVDGVEDSKSKPSAV
jgi:hypothetical protein